MRIIGNIEHPSLKISIFRMDNRTSVKFENALYEQTYKLGDEEQFATLESIKIWVDAQLLEQVTAVFTQMHRARLEAVKRAFPAQEEDIFEEIV